jgi:hypothetical protein
LDVTTWVWVGERKRCGVVDPSEDWCAGGCAGRDEFPVSIAEFSHLSFHIYVEIHIF